MNIIGDELAAIAKEAFRKFASTSDGRGQGIREWLVTGGSYDVASSSTTELVLNAYDQSWMEANGNDLKRYAWAARESICPASATTVDRRSIGWATISLYYCGFFLCTAWLRTFGHALMYLGGEDTTILSNAPGCTARLQNGTYSVAMTPGRPAVVHLKQVNAGGYHEAFWKFADQRLAKVAEEIAGQLSFARPFSILHCQQAVLDVERFRQVLGKHGSMGREVGWMARLRNEVNYRLGRRTWTPTYRERGVTTDRLAGDISRIVRGNQDRLGAKLEIDRDVRAMIERVSIIFRQTMRIDDFNT